jgi:hypothetical protein
MRLLYPAAGAVALLLTTPGLGLAADRTYNDLAPFTAIQIASGIDALVTVGPAQSVAATAPNAADLDEIKIEVRDGTLKIWRDWDIFDIFGDMGDRQARFTITAPKLDSAEASSGADVEVSGLSGESVWIEASSGADLDATDIQATNVEVDVSSGADVTANGTCTKLEVDVSSGADANLGNLHCTEGEAEGSSGSDATIHVGSTLRAKASSGSDITVKGKPTTTKIDESSGGTITFVD